MRITKSFPGQIYNTVMVYLAPPLEHSMHSLVVPGSSKAAELCFASTLLQVRGCWTEGQHWSLGGARDEEGESPG